MKTPVVINTDEVLQRLDDLIFQATQERSHFYVQSVAEFAKEVIRILQVRVDTYRAMFEGARDAAEENRARLLETQRALQSALCELDVYIAEETDPETKDGMINAVNGWWNVLGDGK